MWLIWYYCSLLTEMSNIFFKVGVCLTLTIGICSLHQLWTEKSCKTLNAAAAPVLAFYCCDLSWGNLCSCKFNQSLSHPGWVNQHRADNTTEANEQMVERSMVERLSSARQANERSRVARPLARWPHWWRGRSCNFMEASVHLVKIWLKVNLMDILLSGILSLRGHCNTVCK